MSSRKERRAIQFGKFSERRGWYEPYTIPQGLEKEIIRAYGERVDLVNSEAYSAELVVSETTALIPEFDPEFRKSLQIRITDIFEDISLYWDFVH